MKRVEPADGREQLHKSNHQCIPYSPPEFREIPDLPREPLASLRLPKAKPDLLCDVAAAHDYRPQPSRCTLRSIGLVSGQGPGRVERRGAIIIAQAPGGCGSPSP